MTDSSDSDTRDPYGVGPAYPSSHTQFTDSTPSRYPVEASEPVEAPPAEEATPYYTPSAEPLSVLALSLGHTTAQRRASFRSVRKGRNTLL